MGWVANTIDWVKQLFYPASGLSTLEEVSGAIEEVLIKKSDSYAGKWCLVHDDIRVVLLVPPPSKVWVGADRIMIVGSEQELRELIRRLGLEERDG